MSDTLPTGEEEVSEELDVSTEPETLASELGLELSDEERVEAEQMVARLRSQFGVDQEEEAEPEPEPSEPEEEEPEEPAVEEEPATPSAEDWITIDGRAVPVAEARSMLELRQYLAQNPDTAERVRKAIEGERPEPEQPEPAAPEWMDLEDPSQRFMWEQFKAQHGQIVDLQKRIGGIQADTAKQNAQQVVNSAMGTFRTNHPELTEDDLQKLRLHAGALNIIDGLRSVMSDDQAVLKALDLAYSDHPEFRARAKGEPTPKEAKAQERKAVKQKLSGLAGSSTGATREPTPAAPPATDREARKQAAEWLTQQGILG